MKTAVETQRQVNRQELEQRVKNMYREVALHPEVTYHFEMGRGLAERLCYPGAILDELPVPAIESFAGVGYHFDLAQLQEGEFVVDLGSGSGMDVFFAAFQVGKAGKVIGIDMTSEQLSKARKLSVDYGFRQANFIESYIENMRLENGSADAVISNGVINLSGDKARVFQEAARVLKIGGRLVLSDIVTSVKLPESISCNATLWAACIGGAMQKDDYYSLIEESGLRVMEVKKNPYEFLSNSAKGASRDYGIESISLLAMKK